MHAADALFESSVPGLPLLGRGKVRDIYGIDDDHLLIVATDRLSAYDVVLPDPVPGKGELLTQLSLYWLRKTSDIIDNQLTGLCIADVVADTALAERLRRRSLVVKRLKPLPIEAVIRAYLAGSGWRDYRETGAVCGIDLADGLALAARLPAPLFTPATKANAGAHDENIDFAAVEDRLGSQLARKVRDTSIAIYRRALEHAADRGIIIADTKFEFGLDREGRLHLIDEVLTPDSSRFWPAGSYAAGTSPPSFDKQFVRDYLDRLKWDRRPPGPHLPAAVVQQTAAKYREAYRRLTAPL